ncbi:uncharacterized protein LOC119074148 [Bradysia coprophila]|uniref:uncharacterized protein LOC119074148 n=1 Tax=Bradysia coprophila TaxID=38358 RepID=UPI00187DC340|nr:uncharacterized protein LOC119074148 [Bradysia coprophila]
MARSQLQVIFIYVVVTAFIGSGYPNHYPMRCSSKLEMALERMLRKDQSRSGFRSHIDLPPYTQSPLTTKSYFSNVNEKMDYDYDSDERAIPHRNVEVAELRVRLPTNARWVHVDKCTFVPENRTLDTRLVFPDLTISGKVFVRPHQGNCEMILRLRRAGIEFHTTPIVEERSRAASVRTDSHFAEPGFISVYAHGCDGLSPFKYRQNSKRNPIFDQNNDEQRRYDFPPYGPNRYDRYDRLDRPHNFKKRSIDDALLTATDDIRFDDELLDNSNSRSESRTFGNYFDNNREGHRMGQPFSGQWQNVELANSDEQDDAYSRELEDLFSKGVRSILTSYMQKALQPAIKETLMESMGYTLSYG